MSAPPGLQTPQSRREPFPSRNRSPILHVMTLLHSSDGPCKMVVGWLLTHHLLVCFHNSTELQARIWLIGPLLAYHTKNTDNKKALSSSSNSVASRRACLIA